MQNMRADSDEKKFTGLLLQIGNGTYLHTNLENIEIIDLLSSIISTDINNVYNGEAFKFPEAILKLSNVAVLAPKNECCGKINENALKLISEEVHIYTSVNRSISENYREVCSFQLNFMIV